MGVEYLGPDRKAERYFYSATITYDPAKVIYSDDWETECESIIEEYVSDIHAQTADYITRQAKKAKVTKWQLLLSARVLTNGDMEVAASNDSYIESLRSDYVPMSSGIYDRYANKYRPFLDSAFPEAVEAHAPSGRGFLGASAVAIAIFQVSIRAYRRNVRTFLTFVQTEIE